MSTLDYFKYYLITGEKEGKVEQLHYECKFALYGRSPTSWFEINPGSKLRADENFATHSRDMGLVST